MSLFDLFKRCDINEEAASREERSVLPDVRGSDEYMSGHIPGAVNIHAIHAVNAEPGRSSLE